MEIRRTANAGVLINLDGIRILLDGVNNPTENYLGTPDVIREELTSCLPDVVCLTHIHSDHCDDEFLSYYKNKTLRPILGSECSCFSVGGVKITAIRTRHLGRVEVEHYSFIIEGSQCIYFMGDAAPICFKDRNDLKKPDAVIVPFAYLNTKSAYDITKSLSSKVIVAVHMPSEEKDPFNIWSAVRDTTKEEKTLYFPKINDIVSLQ